MSFLIRGSRNDLAEVFTWSCGLGTGRRASSSGCPAAGWTGLAVHLDPTSFLLISGKTTSERNFSQRLPEMCSSERLGVVFRLVRDSDFYFVMLEII